MKRIPLTVVGAGGHGREARQYIIDINSQEETYEFVGFIDDGHPKGERITSRLDTIIGNVDFLIEHDLPYIVAIGSPTTRRMITERLNPNKAISLIHPAAYIGTEHEYGPGLIAAPGSVVTTGVRIGRSVHLNIATTVSHDCAIGDFVTITPGANISGAVTIGDNTWIGVGSTVMNGVKVGPDVTLGAGATAISDLPAGGTYVGTPAGPIRKATR